MEKTLRALSRCTILPTSPQAHQLGSSLNPILLGFYGGMTQVWLIKSSTVGNWTLTVAPLPSQKIRGMIPLITGLMPLVTSPPILKWSSSVHFISVAQSCPTLCDPMNHSTLGPLVHHKFPEFAQTHAHRVSDAIEPSHPLSSPSPPAPNPSQHQSHFKWVNSSHQGAKVLEFQLQHQSFQWTPRTDLL